MRFHRGASGALKYASAWALILLLAIFPHSLGQQGLAITVQADAPQKKPGDQVAISGRVTISGAGVAGALVGITVTGPDGNPIVARSVSTSQDGSYLVDPFVLSDSSAAGTYTITASTVFQGQGASSSTAFTIPSSVATRRCLIATATFGSSLSPEVSLLREFRDHDLMSSKAGAAFMTAFDGWYYSFSPPVSEVVKKDELLRSTMRMILVPLVASIGLSKAWFDSSHVLLGSDASALTSGVMAAGLVGLIYLSIPAALLVRSPKVRLRVRYLWMPAAAIPLLLSPFEILAQLGATALVLTTAISSAVLANREMLVGPGRSILRRGLNSRSRGVLTPVPKPRSSSRSSTE